MAALACCSCGKVTLEEKMMTAIENAQAAKKGDVTVKIGSNMVVGDVYLDYTIELDYKTIGEDVKVNFPDDLDTYVIPQTAPLDSVA